MKIEIKSRLNGRVIFSAETESLKLAVELAVGSGANLSGADLSWADLFWADLSWAKLSRANLDFSALPLWCGGQRAKIDERLARLFVAHALAFDCDAKWYQSLKRSAKKQCAKSHIAQHLDWLKKGGE